MVFKVYENRNGLRKGLIILFVGDINFSKLVLRLSSHLFQGASFLERSFPATCCLGVVISPNPKPSIHFGKLSAADVG